ISFPIPYRPGASRWPRQARECMTAHGPLFSPHRHRHKRLRPEDTRDQSAIDVAAGCDGLAERALHAQTRPELIATVRKKYAAFWACLNDACEGKRRRQRTGRNPSRLPKPAWRWPSLLSKVVAL